MNSAMKKKIIINYVLPILFIGLAFMISKLYFQLLMIQGDSMEPSYHNGQIVLLDKRKVKEYHEQDVIAFFCEELNCNLVKRIDHIDFVEETGEICYYVLGDNLNMSVDSRDERVGMVGAESIVGKVL